MPPRESTTGTYMAKNLAILGISVMQNPCQPKKGNRYAHLAPARGLLIAISAPTGLMQCMCRVLFSKACLDMVRYDTLPGRTV